MNTLLALLKYERKLFFRDKRGLAAIFLFTALVILLLYFGLGHFNIDRAVLVPNVVWLAVLFGGTLQLNRTFDFEREEMVMDGLKMIPGIAGKIYFSKFTINTLVLFLVIIFATFVASILFNYSAGFLFLIPIALGAISMSAIGTTFSSMLIGHHKKDIILPALFYPLMAPVVIAVIKAADYTTPATAAWMKLIIVFCIIYTTVSYLVFDSVLED